MSSLATTTRTKATLARLEAHLEAHPEIRDRTARWLAGEGRESATEAGKPMQGSQSRET